MKAKKYHYKAFTKGGHSFKFSSNSPIKSFANLSGKTGSHIKFIKLIK